MAAGVRIDGLKQAQRNLQRLGTEVSELKASMIAIADHAAQDAKSLAPVRSGSLRDSVRGNKAKAKATVRAGGKRAYWAPFVEYGTSLQPEKRFVTRAVEQNTEYAIRQIEKDIANHIRRLSLN